MGPILQYVKELELLALASIFGMVNALIRPAKSSLWLYLVEFIVSVVVATFVGIESIYLGLGSATSFSLTAISALLARDMLSLVVGFGGYVVERKETLFSKLFNSLVGKLPSEKGEGNGEK